MYLGPGGALRTYVTDDGQQPHLVGGAVGGEGLEDVVQAGQDTVINMTENGNVVATTVETPTLIKIAYAGP